MTISTSSRFTSEIKQRLSPQTPINARAPLFQFYRDLIENVGEGDQGGDREGHHQQALGHGHGLRQVQIRVCEPGH